jgi:WD40 repeat protein
MKRQLPRSLAAVVAVLSALAAAPVNVSADDGPPKTPILRLELGMHSSKGWQASTDAQGKFVLTSSDDKTGRLWDASSGQLLRIYRVPSETGTTNGNLYACALSPDGKIAAMGGYDWDSGVYIFDRQSGQMTKRLSGLSGNNINRLHFTSDGQYLAAALWRGYAVWRTRDWSLVGMDTSVKDDSNGLDFSRRDGGWTMAASCDDGKIRVYRLGDTLQKLFEFDAGRKNARGLSFNPDGSLLAVGFDEAMVQVLSVSSTQMSRAYSPDLANCPATRLSVVTFSQDGKTLFAGGGWLVGAEALIRIWSAAGRGTYTDVKTGGIDASMSMEAMPGGGTLVGGADPYWAVLDDAGAVKASVSTPVIDFWNAVGTFKLGPGGRVLSLNDGKAALPLSFDTTTRNMVHSTPPSTWKLPDTTSLKVENWHYAYNPTLDGKPLQITNGERAYCIAIAPGSKQLVLGGNWYMYSYDPDGKQLWKKPVPGSVWTLNISDDGRLVVASFHDGTVRWLRLTDGQLLLSLFPHPDGKRWVLWTPSGYYDASPGGEDLIGWQVNNGMDAAADFFPAARFRSTYYRPDVVNLMLTTLDEGQALASANAEAGRRQDSGSIMDKRPPIVLITSPDQGSVFSTGTVTVRYRARSSADAPVTSVRALVDGRPIDGARGLAVVPATDGDSSMQLSLPARDCTVSLIAENKNGPSEAVSIKLLWKGAAPSQDEFVIKPKLYVLSVGVSAYQKPEYHLNYSAKDARDFAALLGKGSPLYRGVETRVLADADANKDDILDGLDWIQKQTTSKDVAVILFSGHGINDSNGNYYYLPVEADVDRLKRTGVPFSDIKNTVSAIPGKVLFFIDTCHSGNLMAGRRAAGAERDIVGVINELASAENGAVVFASSTGSQYSYKDPAWGNGAFTKALLEGLGGAAAYGQGGRVTVNMLDLYLSERVKELTGGKQTPTTTKPANVPDFPVAMKR